MSINSSNLLRNNDIIMNYTTMLEIRYRYMYDPSNITSQTKNNNDFNMSDAPSPI